MVSCISSSLGLLQRHDHFHSFGKGEPPALSELRTYSFTSTWERKGCTKSIKPLIHVDSLVLIGLLCRFPQIWEVQHSPASCSCEHILQPHSARVCRIPVAGGHGHHSWGARNSTGDSWHRSHSERTNRKENIFKTTNHRGKNKRISC